MPPWARMASTSTPRFLQVFLSAALCWGFGCTVEGQCSSTSFDARQSLETKFQKIRCNRIKYSQIRQNHGFLKQFRTGIGTIANTWGNLSPQFCGIHPAQSPRTGPKPPELPRHLASCSQHQHRWHIFLSGYFSVPGGDSKCDFWSFPTRSGGITTPHHTTPHHTTPHHTG